jgi:pyridoxamine 5'-phosphate oxidase-like protein
MSDPIDLTPFAERVDGARDEGCTMVIATVDDGQPDVSLRGSLMVWDRDHLAFWERTFLETYAGLRRNPKVAALYFSPARKEPPLRFYGEANVVEDPALRERIWDRVIPGEQKSDPEKKGVAVLVRIDRVRRGRDVIQQRG